MTNVLVKGVMEKTSLWDKDEFITASSNHLDKLIDTIKEIEPRFFSTLRATIDISNRAINFMNNDADLMDGSWYSIDKLIPSIENINDISVINQITDFQNDYYVSRANEMVSEYFDTPCSVELYALRIIIGMDKCWENKDILSTYIDEVIGKYYLTIVEYSANAFDENRGIATKVEEPKTRIEMVNFNPDEFVNKTISERYSYVEDTYTMGTTIKTIDTSYI